MWYAQGKLERAAAALTRALPIAQRSADSDVVVTADNLLGHIEHAAGNLTSARERHARSLETFRAPLGHPTRILRPHGRRPRRPRSAIQSSKT
jgi:hypothetical protein